MESRIVWNDVYLVVDLRGRGTHFQLVHVEREMLNKSTAEEMEKRNLAEKLSAACTFLWFSGSVQLRLFLHTS